MKDPGESKRGKGGWSRIQKRIRRQKTRTEAGTRVIMLKRIGEPQNRHRREARDPTMVRIAEDAL